MIYFFTAPTEPVFLFRKQCAPLILKSKRCSAFFLRGPIIIFGLWLIGESFNFTEAVEHDSLPHGVQQRALLCDPQQLVWHGHVVCHRLLAVVEEGVGGPDLAGHQVVETQHGHGAFEL